MNKFIKGCNKEKAFLFTPNEDHSFYSPNRIN